ANCPTLFSTPRTFTVAPSQSCGNAKAQLSSPLGGTVSSPVTFNWQAASQAIGYRLWVDIDGGGAQDVATTNGATTATVALTGNSVKWYVEAQFNGCPSTQSVHRVLNVPVAQTCGGQGATNLAPANVTVTSGDVTFTWSAVPNAIAYEVWLGLSGATPSIVASTQTPSFHTTVAAGPLEFFIRTLFNGCDPVDSAHAQFVFTPPANCLTQTPILIAPADGAS